MGPRNQDGKDDTHPPAPSVEEEDISPNNHDMNGDAQEFDREYIQAYTAFKRLRHLDFYVQKPNQQGDEGKEGKSKQENGQIYMGTDSSETHSTPSAPSSTLTLPFLLSSPCTPSPDQLEARNGKEAYGYAPLDPIPQYHAARTEPHYPAPRTTYQETLPTRPAVTFPTYYPHLLPQPLQGIPEYGTCARNPLAQYAHGSHVRSPRSIMAEYYGYNRGAVSPGRAGYSHGRQAGAPRLAPRPYRTMADGNRVYNPDDERVMERKYRGGYNGYNDCNEFSHGEGVVRGAYSTRGHSYHTGGIDVGGDRAGVDLFEAFADVFNVTSQIERDLLTVKKTIEECMFGWFGVER